ncbi:TetR/AcrR family transcriptional regulator [Nocardia cyriacigeorgica]|uniref:TetR/AcrR family transcriptional regulator n=1 Tax=Nocardia cyriacigeorgica TaxID=135487 RepID=A0A6P1CZ75_9NOCA|nr:TetR/AcrR family transcriptional regulator [Nocardia cyriacigeorgica]NEW40182.1 TetR/AcrR family transcriptional regulator [Nocardia cyriacigeorgica]NEW43436.1 TetR/AcrR family transcriptional regulator [Nocardia cyriacigeorgica]NEW59481.1 TetR/AcrR family transcriptional regulator [Nocardia cyriacigeorgica]
MAGQPKRVDAQRNREAIVGAARELVLTRGPGVGMDEIAGAAGVAVGTLYRHFPAKKDLVEAIVAGLSEVVGESLDAAGSRVAAGTSTAIDEIVALLRRVVLEMEQERLLRFAVADLAQDSLRELRNRARNSVAGLVETAHREGALYDDISVDDVILLLATSPVDDSGLDRARWLTLARRALGPGTSG